MRLELGTTEDGRGRLTVQETDAAGVAVRRDLASLVLEDGKALDLGSLRDVLAAARAPTGAEPGYAIVMATLALTADGTRHWTIGAVLPVLATLARLDADVFLQPAPAIRPPTPVAEPRKGVRGPFAEPPEHVSRRSQRWAQAVEAALAWLAAHQSASGQWEAAGWSAWCDVVRRGLLFLKRVQDDEGCFGPREGRRWIYDHGAATWAMVEAAGLTGSPTFLAPAQRGLDFTALCRNPYFAWRYGLKPGGAHRQVPRRPERGPDRPRRHVACDPRRGPEAQPADRLRARPARPPPPPGGTRSAPGAPRAAASTRRR